MQKDSKPKLVIWVVAAEVPSLRGGAPVRNYNLIKQYANQGHAVTVFCIAEHDSGNDVKKLKAVEGVEVIAVPLPKITRVGQLTAALAHRVLPFMRQYRASGVAGELLDMLAQTGSPDVVQLEQVNAYYAAKPALGKLKAAGARIVLDAHNVEQAALETSLEVFSPLKRMSGKYILPRYRRLENRYARDADAVLACSEADRQFFETYNDNTAVIANGVDTDYFKLQLAENKPALLFMGGTDYPPNADGLRWYIEKIHPTVRKKVPAVRLYIIGGKTPDWLQAAADADDSIIPAGYVDDVREYLKKAVVCISPIRKGSGTSLKILEYMSAGKAVVSTVTGARGVDSTAGKDILLADKPQEFATAIITLLSSAAKRRSLGNRARTLMVRKYAWSNIGLAASKSLYDNVSNKRTRRKLIPTSTFTLHTRTLLALSLAWTLAATMVVARGWSDPLLRGALILPIFLLVPGLSILAVLRAKIRTGPRALLYGVSLSLGYWMFGGLAYNNAALALHYNRPLDAAPALLFFEASVVLWIILAYVRNRGKQYKLIFKRPNKTSLGLALASLVTVATAVGGAHVLNNGGSNHLTIVTLCLIALLMLVSTAFYYQLREWVYPVMVFCIGLALLLLYSLRSWHILGWDINLEYQMFQLTQTIGHWNMANAPGAEYNACLSLTILPTLLHDLIGGNPEYIFKVTMQVIFAFVPLGVYTLCRQYIKPVYAFIAAMYYVGQSWYIEQLPALVRQEIAFVFFAAMLLLIFDKALQPRLRAGLATFMAASIVVSHYSTTYVWIAIGLLAIVLMGGLKIFYPAARKQKFALFIGLPLATLAVSLVWFSVYTKTSNNSQGFIKGTLTHASDVFSSEALRGGIQQIGFSGDGTGQAEGLEQYYQTVSKDYETPEGQPVYVPKPAQVSNESDGVLPPRVSELLGMASRISKLLFVNIFPVVGLLYTLWIFKSTRPVDAGYIAVAAAVFPLMMAILFFPFAQEQYNLTRLFMQVMIILALPTVIGFTFLFRQFGTRSHIILAIIFSVFFFYSTGLTAQLAGGQRTITLNQPKEADDVFYAYDTELAGAAWLKNQLAGQKNPLVYADLPGSLRLYGFAGVPNVHQDVFPYVIEKDGYVFTVKSNTEQGIGHVFHDGQTIPYEYPSKYLEETKDVLYNNGTTKVYK